jgi:hypothetical protein
MNSPMRPRTEEEALEQAERLLQRYFAAEVPHHWPAPPARKPEPRRAFVLRRSHLALAASFFFAVGCWWMCGLSSTTVPERHPGVEDGGPAKAARLSHPVLPPTAAAPPAPASAAPPAPSPRPDQ